MAITQPALYPTSCTADMHGASDALNPDCFGGDIEAINKVFIKTATEFFLNSLDDASHINIKKNFPAILSNDLNTSEQAFDAAIDKTPEAYKHLLIKLVDNKDNLCLYLKDEDSLIILNRHPLTKEVAARYRSELQQAEFNISEGKNICCC